MSELSDKLELQLNLNTIIPTNPLHNVLTNAPNQNDEDRLTPGRQKLRGWLGRVVRILITDGRVLVGFLNCTDRDANIVLSMCCEYLEEGKDERLLGNVMVPGRHIVSISLDMPASECTDLCQAPQMPASSIKVRIPCKKRQCLVIRLKRKEMMNFLQQCGVNVTNKSAVQAKEVGKQASDGKEIVSWSQASEDRGNIEEGNEQTLTSQTNDNIQNVEVPDRELKDNTQSYQSSTGSDQLGTPGLL